MTAAAALLGRPYSISGHVIHGQKLGRTLGASAFGQADGLRTLNLRFPHPRPAALGIFAVRTHGLADAPIDGVASLGRRPTVDDSGRVLLEVHCLEWPSGLGIDEGYGKLVQVELLHKLRDEARYDGLAALTAAIRQDVDDARAWLRAHAVGARGDRPPDHPRPNLTRGSALRTQGSVLPRSTPPSRAWIPACGNDRSECPP